nr:hypothetical protein [Tanacetum cinerariifolium]
WQQLAARCGVEVTARWWQRGNAGGSVVAAVGSGGGVVAAAVVTSGVVVAAGWRGDWAAREGEWRGGSDRSGDRESFWVRRKKPAGKVFRRRRGGRPAASDGKGGRRLGIGRET